MSSIIGTPVPFTDVDGGAGASFGITVVAGNRRCMLLKIADFGGTPPPTISSSVDGALTQFGTTVSGGAGDAMLFRLLNPTLGAHTITITYPGATVEIQGVCEVWDDVNQTTPLAGFVSSASNTAAPAATVTVGGGNKGIGFLYFYSGGANAATESDTLILEKDASGAESGYSAQYDSAGSLSWSLTGAADTLVFGAELIHDGGSGLVDAVGARTARFFAQPMIRGPF